MATQNLFSDVFSGFGRLPKKGWWLASIVGSVSSISEFAHWLVGPNLTAADFAIVAFTLPLWLGVSYALSMMMASRQASWSSFIRFAIITVILFLPMIGGFGSMFIASPDASKGLVLSLALLLLVGGWIVLTLFPALPVAQAVSTAFVSPKRVWRATKGHRWSLVVVSFATGSISKLAPEMSMAANSGQAALLAVGHGLVSVGTLLLMNSLGVTAWQYATRNDPSLCGDEPRGAEA